MNKKCCEENEKVKNLKRKTKTIFDKSIFKEKSDDENIIDEKINSYNHQERSIFNFKLIKSTDFSGISFLNIKTDDFIGEKKNLTNETLEINSKEKKKVNIYLKTELEEKEEILETSKITKKNELENLKNKNNDEINYDFESEKDFDSGEEDCYPKLKSVKIIKKFLFIKKTKNKFCKISKRKQNLINLGDFIKNKFLENFEKGRVYLCNFCNEKFNKPSSLGGHTAKLHPNLSKEYKYRLMSLKNRVVERKRIKYFRKLDEI